MKIKIAIKAFLAANIFTIYNFYMYSQDSEATYSICKGCKIYPKENIYLFEKDQRLINNSFVVGGFIFKIKDDSKNKRISKDSLKILNVMSVDELLLHETNIHKQKAKEEKITYLPPVITQLGRFTNLSFIAKDKQGFAIYKVEHLPGIKGSVSLPHARRKKKIWPYQSR